MKLRLLSVFAIILTSASLASCTEGPVSSPSVSSTEENNLFFSKYFESGSVSNNCLELYNNSDNDISLKNYIISIYQNGSKVSDIDIELDGIIKSKDYFVISTNSSSVDLINEKADLKLDNLLFNGDDAIVLKKGGQVVDALGDYLNGSGSEFG
ncbi:MAG: lamin tail domain-containing protein, partial [Bacillales bacterium]|nr:lamin tail domain-containing protein [Bacillales bacterium]